MGMWTFVWRWTRHWCYAEHGVGWGGVGKTAQVYMHNDHWNWQGKKRSGFRVEGLPNARNMTFFFKDFYFETATKHWKGCHFLTMVMRLHARFRTRRDVYVASLRFWSYDFNWMLVDACGYWLYLMILANRGLLNSMQSQYLDSIQGYRCPGNIRLSKETMGYSWGSFQWNITGLTDFYSRLSSRTERVDVSARFCVRSFW